MTEDNRFKSDDARRRFEVYQEGQRAFSTDADCPYGYRDWRFNTWHKGYRAAREYTESLLDADCDD